MVLKCNAWKCLTTPRFVKCRSWRTLGSAEVTLHVPLGNRAQIGCFANDFFLFFPLLSFMGPVCVHLSTCYWNKLWSIFGHHVWQTVTFFFLITNAVYVFTPLFFVISQRLIQHAVHIFPVKICPGSFDLWHFIVACKWCMETFCIVTLWTPRKWGVWVAQFGTKLWNVFLFLPKLAASRYFTLTYCIEDNFCLCTQKTWSCS